MPESVPTPVNTPVLVVDAANVVGSRPDGWWRDRVGAAQRLLLALAGAVDAGADGVGRRIVVVLEGRAREAAPDGVEGVTLVRAPASGDDAVVEVVREHREAGCEVTVVTSDRELRERVTALGAAVRGASWLREVLDGVPGTR